MPRFAMFFIDFAEWAFHKMQLTENSAASFGGLRDAFIRTLYENTVSHPLGKSSAGNGLRRHA